MTLAIWNYPPAEFLVSGFTSGGVTAPVEIRRGTIPECVAWLAHGDVDAALLPTLYVFRESEALDVLPTVALSTWSYPYARLVLRGGLSKAPDRVIYNPAWEQEAFLARLILKEHYRMTPAFVPLEGAGVDVLLAAEADAVVVAGADVPFRGPADALVLDLGQEWSELANYPMVWGLIACRKGEATPALIRAVRDNARAADRQRSIWVRAQETSTEMHTFYREDLRIQLDDLATAGLTEYSQYLFYYEVLSEITVVPFAFLEDEDDEADDGSSMPKL